MSSCPPVIYTVVGRPDASVERGPHPWSRAQSWFNADHYGHESVYDRWCEEIRNVWPDAEVYWDHRGPQVEWSDYYMKIVRVRHPEAERWVQDVKLTMRLHGLDPAENALEVHMLEHGLIRMWSEDVKRKLRRPNGRFRTQRVRVCWLRERVDGCMVVRGWEHQAELRAVRKTQAGAVWTQGGVQIVRWCVAEERWVRVEDVRVPTHTL